MLMRLWRWTCDATDGVGNGTGSDMAPERAAGTWVKGCVEGCMNGTTGCCRELHVDAKLMEEMKTASYPANRGTTVRRDRYEWAETRGDLGQAASLG